MGRRVFWDHKPSKKKIRAALDLYAPIITKSDRDKVPIKNVLKSLDIKKKSR